MKRALVLLLLTVFIACLSVEGIHEGGYQQKEKQRGRQKYRDGFRLVLSFEYAARDGLWNQDSNRFRVVFNGQTVRSFLPSDYKLHRVRFNLNGRYGKNSLHFIGEGVSDSYGAQIDNVRLVRKDSYSAKNYIKNGDFESGHKLGYDNKAWRFFKDGEVVGWRCVDEMQIGWGNIYNRYWPCDTHVCELDAARNSEIYQKFTIGKEAKEGRSDSCSEE